VDYETEAALGDLQDMYAAHTLLRREFGLAPGLVHDVADHDTRRAQLVCDYLDLIVTLLELHHGATDGCPRTSGAELGDAFSLVDPDHARFHYAVEQVTACMARWRRSASALDARTFAQALQELGRHLNNHLARREEEILWPRAAAPASEFTNDGVLRYRAKELDRMAGRHAAKKTKPVFLSAAGI
jgi:hypothetical protein